MAFDDLLAALGKDANSPEARAAIKDHGLTDVKRSPPDGRYQGSKKKGVCLVIENEQVAALQIYVKSDGLYAACVEPLPFGIKEGMTQAQVEKLIGKPIDSDEYSSQFQLSKPKAKLSVVYDDSVVKYISVDADL